MKRKDTKKGKTSETKEKNVEFFTSILFYQYLQSDSFSSVFYPNRNPVQSFLLSAKSPYKCFHLFKKVFIVFPMTQLVRFAKT